MSLRAMARGPVRRPAQRCVFARWRATTPEAGTCSVRHPPGRSPRAARTAACCACFTLQRRGGQPESRAFGASSAPAHRADCREGRWRAVHRAHARSRAAARRKRLGSRPPDFARCGATAMLQACGHAPGPARLAGILQELESYAVEENVAAAISEQLVPGADGAGPGSLAPPGSPPDAARGARQLGHWPEGPGTERLHPAVSVRAARAALGLERTTSGRRAVADPRLGGNSLRDVASQHQQVLAADISSGEPEWPFVWASATASCCVTH